MRRALQAKQRQLRLFTTGYTLLARFGGVFSAIIGLLFVVVGGVWLALGVLGVLGSNLLGHVLLPLLLVGMGLMTLFSSLLRQQRRMIRESSDTFDSKLNRDLEGGVYLESVGDAAVRVSPEHTDGPGFIYQLVLPERTLEVRDLGVWLPESDSPFQGVMVRYTPSAEIVFDITASDGRVLYRGVALDER
jgi:hypothetical protein